MNPRTVGVEEELLLVDPDSGQPRSIIAAVLADARAEAGSDAPETVLNAELQQEQLETETRTTSGGFVPNVGSVPYDADVANRR